MARIRINAASVAKAFNRLRGGIRELFDDRRLEKSAVQHIRDRFEHVGSNPRAQTAPDGVPWPPYSPNTARIAASLGRKVNPAQKLVQSGALRNSIGVVSGGLSGLGRLSNRRGSVLIGIRDGAVNPRGVSLEEIGKLQNFGGTVLVFGKHPAKVPAREFMGFDQAYPSQVEGILQDTVGAAARGFGRAGRRGATGLGAVRNQLVSTIRSITDRFNR